MQRNIQDKTSWRYLAGFYDGEGSIGLRVVKEKRPSRAKTETDGWCIAPYLEIANTNLEVLKIIQKFLRDKRIISHIVTKNPKNKNYRTGSYLCIQSYNGIRKFLKNIYPYSLIKRGQIDIVNKFFTIRDNLPILKRGTRIDNLKRNHWTKELFLEAMKLRDDLKILNLEEILDTSITMGISRNYGVNIWFSSYWQALNFGSKKSYIEILEG